MNDIIVSVGERFRLKLNGMTFEIVEIHGESVYVRDEKTGKLLVHNAAFIRHLDAERMEGS